MKKASFNLYSEAYNLTVLHSRWLKSHSLEEAYVIHFPGNNPWSSNPFNKTYATKSSATDRQNFIDKWHSYEKIYNSFERQFKKINEGDNIEAMTTRKLKEIEEARQILEAQEKDINNKLNLVNKEEAFQEIVNSIMRVYALYVATTGTDDGCIEMMQQILNANKTLMARKPTSVK